MTDLEAMKMRYSRRSYLDTPISKDKLRILMDFIDKYNKDCGLSIQFIENGSEAFRGLSRSYGLFSGVRSFFAMVGNTADEYLKEKIGYYGELLVLEATKLGLGTCWVGGSFDRKHCPCTLTKSQSLVCVITVGNIEDKQTFREKAIYRLIHHKRKPLEYFYTSDAANPPEWFLAGIRAASIAPSAANLQPVHFNFKNGRVTAQVRNPIRDQIDLGISKAHFGLAAGGHFEMGNQGAFRL
jgi:nitroreductase